MQDREYRMIGREDMQGFLGEFFIFIARIIRFILLSLRRFFIPALIVFLLIASGGFLYWRSHKPVYETEMVCQFNNLSKKVYGDMLLKLDLLIQSQSWHTLAEALQMPEEQVAKITSLQGLNMQGSQLHEDVTSYRDPLYIKVKATDKAVFAPLEKSILDYLNTNSPYRLLRNEMELASINQKIRYLDRNLGLSDTVLLAYSSFLHNIKLAKNTTAGFSNVSHLLNYKNELEDKRIQNAWRIHELDQSVEILHGFLPPDKPERGRSKILIAGLALGLVAACGLAVFLNILFPR